MKLCRQCAGPLDQDDVGASYGNGFLCMLCGLYRLPKAKSETTRTKRIKVASESETQSA